MYLIRYEKDSIKDYILYEIDDNQIYPIISADNGFQICCYLNNNNIIRLFFKILVYNKNIKFFIDNIYEFINLIFKTNNNEWTIIINERMLGSKHIIQLYFFSHTLCISMKDLKKLVSNMYYPEIYFDDSIYYKKHYKYKEFMSIPVPNQTDYSTNYSTKNNYIFKLLIGDPIHLIITNIENLIQYKI
jgi:hypothetical protein